MATLSSLGTAFNEPESGALFVRFIGACLTKAGAILIEDPGTANHANRLIWANAILSNDQASVYLRVRQMHHRALAVDANVQFDPVNVTDADVLAAVDDGLAVFANGN